MCITLLKHIPNSTTICDYVYYSVLGRDLSHCIIVDNSPHAFGYQMDNGVPIESWFDDVTDDKLLQLMPFLMSLKEKKDVRPYIYRQFRTRDLVAASAQFVAASRAQT